MAKDLTGNLTTEIATDEHRPIELFIVYLDSGTLYFTDNDSDVSFYNLSGSAQTYTAVALSRTEVHTNVSSKIDNVTVKLDNVNKGMSSYIASNEFRGRRLVILRVYEDYLTDADDYITIFDGLMDMPTIGEYAMQVVVKSRLGTLSKSVPRRLYQLHCNWEFGSTECGFDKTSTQQTSQVIASGSTSVVYIDGITLEDLADNYWRYGTMEITAGGNDDSTRMITASSGTFAVTGVSGVQLTLDYALDSDPDGDTVTLQQGCDKTYNTCNDTFSNRANYGGFLNIPESLIIR